VRPAGVGRTPGSRFWSLRSSALALQFGALGGVVAVFTAAAVVGDLLSPVFIEHHALVLVVLTPRTGYLVALTREVPLSVFLVVSVARLCAADPIHLMMGRAAGPAVVSAARRTRLLRPLVDRLPLRSGPLWLVAIALSPRPRRCSWPGVADCDRVGWRWRTSRERLPVFFSSGPPGRRFRRWVTPRLRSLLGLRSPVAPPRSRWWRSAAGEAHALHGRPRDASRPARPRKAGAAGSPVSARRLRSR
jgi:hypothetical protein